MEKYQQWNLELMRVIPERKGYGSALLNYVFKDMKGAGIVTVCANSLGAAEFFKKHGMRDNKFFI